MEATDKLNGKNKPSGSVILKKTHSMCSKKNVHWNTNSLHMQGPGQTHYKKYFHKSWREGVRHRAKRLFLGLPRERHYNSFYTPKNV